LVIGNRIFSASFSRILRSPKWFFDTTPVGRFLSRFSKDQEMLDNTLPMYVQQTLASACAIIAVIVSKSFKLVLTINKVVITRSSPWFLCAAVPLMIIYILIQQMYSKSSREIKRIEAIIRSPVYAHLSESLNGIPTIRAYKVEEQFIRQNEKLVNGNLRAWFVQWMLQRWLGLRLETIGAAIILAAGLFMAAGRGKIDPGIIGVTMT
jgi:ATP-binding cassette subfamily C (CFTR/MRP) protein 1